MKNSIVFILALMFFYNQAKTQNCAGATALSNTVFVGVDNVLNVAVDGVKLSDIRLTSNAGEISQINGKYSLKIDGGNKVNIYVYVKGKLLKTIEMNVKRIPDPRITICGKTGGTITMEELIKATINIEKNEFYQQDFKFVITEFTLSHVSRWDEEARSNNSTLSANQLRMLKHMSIGTKVYFENIKARCEDGTTRELGSMAFKIVK